MRRKENEPLPSKEDNWIIRVYILRIIIVGAGVTGLRLFARLKKEHEVVIIDKNPNMGKKLLMTGNGRCNLTNTCDINTFVERCTGDKKVLYSFLNHFGCREIMEYFTSRGLVLKEEEEGRTFPESDRAEDVLKVILNSIRSNSDKFLLKSESENFIFEQKHKDFIAKSEQNFSYDENSVVDFGKTRKFIKAVKVSGLWMSGNDLKGVVLEDDRRLAADVVIVTTGGASMPQTGSTGDGYAWFTEHGHNMEELYPLETAWVSNDNIVSCKNLQGVSFKGSVKIFGKKYSGDFVITHYGFSGPVALDLGGTVYKKAPCKAEFNFMEFEREELESILSSEKEDINLNKVLRRYLPMSLLKQLFYDEILKSRWKNLNSKLRSEVLDKIVHYPAVIDGTRGMKHCFVTGGGLKMKDFNVKTLESLKIKGLYAAGEILNIHGPLGGYNITICLSQAEAICRHLNK